MNINSTNNKYFLGLELAGKQLKIACFIKGSKSYRLIKLDKVLLAANPEKDKEIISVWIRENLQQNSEADAVLSIAESSLYFKELELPKLSKKQQNEAVYWEIANLTPFPKDDLMVDWKAFEQSGKRVKIIAVAGRNSHLTDIVSIFEELGVNISAVEPSSFSFERFAGIDLSSVTLLMTVENEETNLIIIRKKVPVFATSISTPIIPDEGERRKLDKSVIDELASLAQKTIRFWEEKNGSKVEQVVITGDIARKYYGLANTITRKTLILSAMAAGKRVKGVDMSGTPSALKLRYLIPIGAFSRFVNQAETINLLPKLKKDEAEKRFFIQSLQKTSLLLSLMNAVLVVLVLISLLFVNLISKSTLDMENQKRQLITEHEGQKIIEEVKVANEVAKLANELITKQKNAGARLDTIAKVTPKNVKLTAIDFGQLESEEWKVSGMGTRDEILYFYEKLKAEKEVVAVTMPYSNFEKEEENEFEIKIQW